MKCEAYFTGLNQPNQPKNRITVAWHHLPSKVREGKLGLLVSSAHRKEIEAIPDVMERIELEALLDELGVPIREDMSKIRARAEGLVSLGFGIADAAHVAFAECSGAHFISCDEKLLRKCLTHKIKVWCGNPVSFCEKEGLK